MPSDAQSILYDLVYIVASIYAITEAIVKHQKKIIVL